jgi:ABC-type branched-subunit amino acid transport system substrate-binding protein
MDMEAIIAEVAKRHRFVLSPDDPVLATVTLSELVWQEAGRELEARLKATLDAAILGGVQKNCDAMVRDVAASLQTQLARSMAQSRQDWTVSLDEAVAAIQQAARDTARARLWAVVAAAISGAIAMGIVGVLTAPVWLAVLRGGH